MIFIVDYSHITDLGNAVLTKIYLQPGGKSNFNHITPMKSCCQLEKFFNNTLYQIRITFYICESHLSLFTQIRLIIIWRGFNKAVIH